MYLRGGKSGRQALAECASLAAPSQNDLGDCGAQ